LRDGGGTSYGQEIFATEQLYLIAGESQGGGEGKGPDRDPPGID
jgi:hypothetical protein